MSIKSFETIEQKKNLPEQIKETGFEIKALEKNFNELKTQLDSIK